jgi:hypothetical protein
LSPPHFTRIPPVQTVEGVGPGATTAPAIDLNATAVDAAGVSLTVTSDAPAKFPVGSTTVTFTAKDAANQVVTATTVITVTDTTKPVITACAAPQTIFVSGTAAGTLPNLAGSVSATDYSTFTVSQAPAAGAQYSVPANQTTLVVPVTLTVTDSAPSHNTSTCSTTVTFSKASAPVCTAAAASTPTLWPPNHQMVLESVKGVTNPDGSPVTITYTSIFQDEPTAGLGSGDTPIDGVILFGTTAMVRSERSGLDDGRVYYINFTATAAGGSCTGTVQVAVPHDMAHPAVGEGALYDSTKISAPPDNCHGKSDHGHHDGDGCIDGHHGHYDGDNCHAGDGFHHSGDGDKTHK